MSLLSVVIPTYNRAGYLPDAVESVLAQDVQDCEVIIIDDGSTDATQAAVERKAMLWGSRVRYIWQANAERCLARNHGLSLASGEFVAFLDSDDLWRAGHARLCLAALAHDQDAAAAFSEYGLVDAGGRTIRDVVSRPRSRGRQFYRDLCLKHLILHPSEVVVRRSAIPAGQPFDPAIPGAEDWLFWIRLLRKGRFVGTRQATIWMRLHAGGTFGNPAKFTASLLAAAEKVIATNVPLSVGVAAQRVRAINRIHCGYAYYLAEAWPMASYFLFWALCDYPLAVFEPDFMKVAGRLCAGKPAARWARSLRQRPRQGGILAK